MNVTNSKPSTFELEFFASGGRAKVIERLEKDLAEELAHDIKPSDELVEKMTTVINGLKAGCRFMEYQRNLIESLIQLRYESEEFKLSRRADIQHLIDVQGFKRAALKCRKEFDNERLAEEVEAVGEHLTALMQA